MSPWKTRQTQRPLTPPPSPPNLHQYGTNGGPVIKGDSLEELTFFLRPKFVFSRDFFRYLTAGTGVRTTCFIFFQLLCAGFFFLFSPTFGPWMAYGVA
jgi:hypothetical protein